MTSSKLGYYFNVLKIFVDWVQKSNNYFHKLQSTVILQDKNKHYGEMVDMFLKHKTQEMLPEMTPFIDIDCKDLDERVQIVIDKLTGNKNV